MIYASRDRANQENVLRELLKNEEIPLSNNLSERALRRIVKGQRNWLFHGLIATCESLGMDPEFYLQEVLTVTPNYPPKVPPSGGAARRAGRSGYSHRAPLSSCSFPSAHVPCGEGKTT